MLNLRFRKNVEIHELYYEKRHKILCFLCYVVK